MTIEAWIESAAADAERRGLPQLKPLLAGLARSTQVLRAADWNDRADGSPSQPLEEPGSPGPGPAGSTRR
jgi:hypothetical protein